jgi:S1-C subfamily serine protease
MPKNDGYHEYCKENQETDFCGKDLIDNNEEGEELSGEEPRRSSLVKRMVALVTVIAFMGLVVATSWPGLQFPLADLLAKSLQMEKDIDVKRLQEAVVQIDVVSRLKGSSLAAERRSGTGFNIEPGGLIITNHHVIEGALNMAITFPGGKICRAVSWTSKPEFDLAWIKLQEDALPVVPVSREKMPAPGEKVKVVGNPLGLNNVVVEGKLDQYLRVGGNPEVVFSIDAPIYPGNSGSPVFNSDNDVIGVVFASYQSEIDGKKKVFGLAVPVKEVFNNL